MKYSFITQHKNTYPISLQCQVLGVKRQGYYHYRRYTEKKPLDPEHQEMLMWVKEVATACDDTYGSRRMKVALNCLGFPVSRNKAKNLMQEADVKVKRRKKYKVTTNSDHKHLIFENLLNRKFDVAEVDQAYVADITYIWTQEGWLYLAVVIDCCSRKIVGWSHRLKNEGTACL